MIFLRVIQPESFWIQVTPHTVRQCHFSVSNRVEESIKTNEKLLTLHQNCWPVTNVENLDPNRPNAVELFEMKFVIFKVVLKNELVWRIPCSYRFAPLSEG